MNPALGVIRADAVAESDLVQFRALNVEERNLTMRAAGRVVGRETCACPLPSRMKERSTAVIIHSASFSSTRLSVRISSPLESQLAESEACKANGEMRVVRIPELGELPIEGHRVNEDQFGAVLFRPCSDRILRSRQTITVARGRSIRREA